MVGLIDKPVPAIPVAEYIKVSPPLKLAVPDILTLEFVS